MKIVRAVLIVALISFSLAFIKSLAQYIKDINTDPNIVEPEKLMVVNDKVFWFSKRIKLPDGKIVIIGANLTDELNVVIVKDSDDELIDSHIIQEHVEINRKLNANDEGIYKKP